jgi:hypothetical protein
MPGDFVAHELTPPSAMTQEDFVRFVQEEVFPAVVMTPTRMGVITELHLLATKAADTYLWLIKWDGLDEGTAAFFPGAMEAQQKLESSGTLISGPSRTYYEVASRGGPDGETPTLPEEPK